MIYSRIFQKLYASFVLIILFCTAIISLMIARQTQQDSLLEIENSLKSQAIIIRESILPVLMSENHDLLQEQIKNMAHDIDTRITIIKVDGTVLADSNQNPGLMDNHRERPEIKQVYHTGIGVISRFSKTLSKPMRYLALPIDETNTEMGVIRVALPLSHIDERLDYLGSIVIAAASLTAIIALLLGFWIARSFADPLHRMTDMAKHLSKGNYNIQLDLERQDEIGDLAMSINQLAQTAAKREAIRRDFVANASHELKTPVTAIQSIAETLLEDEKMEPETRNRFIHKINNQSIRLSQLVSDLLALSRLEAEGPENFEFFNIKETIKNSCITLQQSADEKKIKLTAQLPETEVTTFGDENALSQLIDNLIDNAIKYTMEGGHVTIRLNTESDQTSIEVEDDGIGIAEDEQQRIFERFYRVDKARSKTLDSTGLGLSIVKHVVLKHQGNISLESKLNQGALFRITLPVINSQ